MKKFLEEARKGYIMDLKITSNYSDLESGKLKIVTENPDTIDTVRSLLDDKGAILGLIGWRSLPLNRPTLRVIPPSDPLIQPARGSHLHCPGARHTPGN